MAFIPTYLTCLILAVCLTVLVGLAQKITVTHARRLRDWAAIIGSVALAIAQTYTVIDQPWRHGCIYGGAADLVAAVLALTWLMQSCKGDAFNNKDVVVVIAGAASLVLGVLLLIVGIATSVGMG